MFAAFIIFYISVSVGAFAYISDNTPGLAWYGFITYAFLSLVWPVWFPALVMRRLMEAVMP